MNNHLTTSKRKLANWEETEETGDETPPPSLRTLKGLTQADLWLSFPSLIVRSQRQADWIFVVAKDDSLLELLALIALRMNATWEPCYIHTRSGNAASGRVRDWATGKACKGGSQSRGAHHWPIPDWLNFLDKIYYSPNYITITFVASIRSDQCPGRFWT